MQAELSQISTCWIFRGKSSYYYHQMGRGYGPKCYWQAANRFELFAGNQLRMRKATPSMLRVFNINQIAQLHSES
jgi:hypothetical protein